MVMVYPCIVMIPRFVSRPEYSLPTQSFRILEKHCGSTFHTECLVQILTCSPPIIIPSRYSTHCNSSTSGSFVQWPKHERLVFLWFGALRNFCYPLPMLPGAEEIGEPQCYENCVCVLCYPFVRSTYLASHILYTYKCEVVRLHAIKEYRGSRDTAPLGLNLGARWVEWSPSHSGRLTSKEEPRTHWVGGWMVLRPAIDVLERRKLLSICRDLNPVQSSFQPSHYTDCCVHVVNTNIITIRLG